MVPRGSEFVIRSRTQVLCGGLTSSGAEDGRKRFGRLRNDLSFLGRGRSERGPRATEDGRYRVGRR
jgi:hypothetical protein